ncbi:MAG: amidohydrolase family protein [Anaerolineaceae bacterium]|nr:amidohydrolase family protein [Anaerolineaceae bacterium]
MLILPAWLVVSAQEKPRENWGVRISGQVIADVAPNVALKQRYPAEETWEAAGQVLAPGFVDAHTHLYGLLAHGIPLAKAPSGFMPFLEDFWWPLVENRLDKEMIIAATDYNCAAMIRSGITSFYDCEEAPNALPGILNAQSEVVRSRGLRGVLSFEATQRLSPYNGQLGLQENAEFIDATGKQGGLVRGLMCYHTTFTCDVPFIRQAYRIAEERGVLVHAHCSEGAYEPRYALEKFGKRPIEYYEALGVLSERSLLSQCVQVDGNEIELLARRKARMTHMPLSNCEVGGGIAPVPALVAAGVTVGLGSDGYITDFFEVMRGAFLIHKANLQDPTVMPAALVWYLATEGGAKAIGLDHVGRLSPGWQADLQLFKADLPTPLKEHNLYDQTLLYCHQTDVTGTLVAGKTLMREGSVLGVDESAIQERTWKSAERLWSLA